LWGIETRRPGTVEWQGNFDQGNAMPKCFDSLGISFQYPDNWRLDDFDALLGRKSVTVFSPGGAFWSVAVHSGSADPEKLTKAVVDTLRKEYDSLEVDSIVEDVAGHELTGYDLAFYCLDLTNTAKVRSVRADYSIYTVYCQAEDREYVQLDRVFQAMTVTFLNSLRDKT
jgi:hypothetical protein